MPPKDFKGALNKQQIKTPLAGSGYGRLGVVGDAPNPIREELERNSATLPIREIAIERLHDNPYQEIARPVLDEDSLKELVSSIQQNGFYGALLARRKHNTNDQYELAYGHRRREAARRAGLKELPVKVIELSDTQMAQIMASENFSREDLTPIGEANVLGHLYTTLNMSIEQVAEAIGKGKGWVQLRLNLYQASKDIKAMVEQKPDALSHVRLLVQIKDPVQREPLIQAILQNNLTFEQLRSRLDAIKQAATKSEIDKKITIYSNAAYSAKNHNVSRESVAQYLVEELPFSPELAERKAAFDRLNNAVKKFENLIGKKEYKLAKDEKDYLEEIVERLSSLLED
jgi:ParB family chromosome partitioning protein